MDLPSILEPRNNRNFVLWNIGPEGLRQNDDTHSLFNGSRSVPYISGIFVDPVQDSLDQSERVIEDCKKDNEKRNIQFVNGFSTPENVVDHVRMIQDQHPDSRHVDLLKLNLGTGLDLQLVHCILQYVQPLAISVPFEPHLPLFFRRAYFINSGVFMPQSDGAEEIHGAEEFHGAVPSEVFFPSLATWMISYKKAIFCTKCT